MNKLTIIRGDDVTIPVTFTDSDGDPINLTGCTVFFTVKNEKSDDDDDAVISKSVTSHTTPASGITQVVLTHTDTDIDPGSYYWDLQIKDSAGKIQSTQVAQFEVIQDITTRIE
jgi:hypothetical protein